MTTILLTTLGTDGDINPFIALANALKKKGARPILLVNPGVHDRIAQAGLEARWVGEPMEASRLIVENPKYMETRGGEHVFREIFVPYAPLLYKETEKAIREEGAAMVVSHVGCFGSIWAAKAAGLSSVVVHLAPASVFSRESLGVYPWPIRAFYHGLLQIAPVIVNRWLKQSCREAGIHWHPNLLMETTQRPDLLLGLWSPLYRGPAGDDWEKSKICGFPASAKSRVSLSAEVTDFIDRGEPPIVFGLGSSAVHVAGDFYVHATRACMALKRRGLLVCGEAAPEDLPENILAVSYAPYSKIFPRCAAIVHHGGIGTTGESLRAGRPSVVTPFAHDQFDNAARLQALRISHTLPRRNMDARSMVSALGQVLTNEVSQQAEQMGREIRAEGNGAERAAEEIMALVPQ